jgi:hypothetical protein
LPVAWDDILSTFTFVSFDGGGNSAFVCRRTGAVLWRSEFGDSIDELPDDIDSDNYLALPGPRDLDLGKPLVMRFTEEILPDHAPTIAPCGRPAFAPMRSASGASCCAEPKSAGG